MHTHPELLQISWTKFAALPTDRFKCVVAEFWLPAELAAHSPYGLTLPHRTTELNYFFVQTPPDQSGPNTVQILISDARRRIRAVHYDRGIIVNAMDIEAKEMADCRRRFDSFNKSDVLKGKAAAYQLAQLGIFFVGDRNAVGKLRCSFCRRTMHMFSREEVPYLEKEFERRLIALLQRHSHLSAICMFSLGLNGDDKRLSADDIARVIEPFIRTQAIQTLMVELCLLPYIDYSSLQMTGAFVLSKSPLGLPPIDGEDSTTYFEAIAELEYEMLSHFQSEPDFESELSVVDDLTPQSTPIDYLIGVPPKHREYLSIQKRVDSFEVSTWRQQSISRQTSSLLTPESFARAGFFYSGTADNVMCYWCGLGLNHWEPTDDPITEHARFTPRCTWLLRTIGRHRVKELYMKSTSILPDASAGIQNIKAADYAFLRDVQEIAGPTWDCGSISPLNTYLDKLDTVVHIESILIKASVRAISYRYRLLSHYSLLY